MTAASLLLLLVLSAVRCGETAQTTEARFSVGGNIVARAGEETFLFCNREDRTADPPSSYVWVKDGKVRPGHSRHVLTLSSVTRQDAPDSTSYGRGVHLKVFVPGDVVPRPNLTPNGWQIKGQPFSLFCNFHQDYIPVPATTYTWYKNSEEMKGHKGDILRFSSLAETDQGDYTCTAREGAAETTSSPSYEVDLRILVPAQVRMQPPGPVVRGVRGENLTLTCEVTRAFPDVPDDGYSWSYLPSPKGPQRHLEDTGGNLTLGPLTLEDRGQYVCQARNDQWYRHLDFTLGGNASVTVDVVYLDNLILTSDLEVSEGDHVTLTCAVDSRPTAQLAWTVHGQEVRHVIDNVDHYVISRAACSDSGSYTCAASNTELPGRDRHASLQLYVHCNHFPIFDTVETKVGAIFNFPLPDWTPMVVVHPGGRDVISVDQDCSYNVSPAFQSRCLQPWCDSKRHRLSFTLTNVTEEDEGEYVCLEEGPQRRPIYNCSEKLQVNKHIIEMPQNNHSRVFVIALATSVSLLILLVGVLTGICLGRRYSGSSQKIFRWRWVKGERSSDDEEDHLMKSGSSLQSVEGRERGKKEKKIHTFESLYTKGRVYMFPPLVPAKDDATSETESNTENESTALLSAQGQKLSAEQEVFKVKDLLRATLQNSLSIRAEDLPSFILHNYRLDKQEKTILVVDQKMGVVVMVVNTATSPQELKSAEKSARHLMEVRHTVSGKLRRLVTSGAVRAVLSLPCLDHNEAEDLKGSLKVLRSHPDVELLAGQDPRDFRHWAERLGTGHREVWQSNSQEIDSSESVYKKVAGRFLTLAGCIGLDRPVESPDLGKSLLLTPAQMEVRDNTARLLHVWGPPGSGKTTLLVHRARQWLAEGKAVILAVGGQFYDIALAEINRAVSKGQGKETCSKLKICSTVYEMQKAVKILKDKHADVDVFLIVDILWEIHILKILFPDIRSGRVSFVWTAGWDSLHSVPNEFSKQLHDLGWESLPLPDCIRCTEDTVDLLNQLGHGVISPISSCIILRDQDIPAWRVVDHCLHPDNVKTVTSCDHCKKEMSAALPSTKQGPHLDGWVALLTGDPNTFVNYEPAMETAEQFGFTISYDSDRRSHYEAVLSSSPSRQSTLVVSNFADVVSQVLDGVDEKGQPTVHLLRVEDFKGMEREGVILVHWDHRDNHPGRQSQGDRDTRLEEHRRQWFQAASRSTGQVILLLLSPSPARSLLGLPEPVMA